MTDTNAVSAATGGIDHSELQGFIRDLYATIAFFTANPEIPVPSGMTLHVKMSQRAQVRALAEKLGAPEYGEDLSGEGPSNRAQCDVGIPDVRMNANVLIYSL